MAIYYFEVEFDLEVQVQSTPKTIGILTKVFCSSGPNLVFLAWTGDKLSRGQASDYRTHRRTHRQTQATTIPEGQNWPRVMRVMPSHGLRYLPRWCIVLVIQFSLLKFRYQLQQLYSEGKHTGSLEVAFSWCKIIYQSVVLYHEKLNPFISQLLSIIKSSHCAFEKSRYV